MKRDMTTKIRAESSLFFNLPHWFNFIVPSLSVKLLWNFLDSSLNVSSTTVLTTTATSASGAETSFVKSSTARVIKEENEENKETPQKTEEE